MKMRLFLSAAVAAVSVAPPASAALAAQDSTADYTQPYQQRALEIYRTIVGIRSAAGHGQCRRGSGKA